MAKNKDDKEEAKRKKIAEEIERRLKDDKEAAERLWKAVWEIEDK